MPAPVPWSLAWSESGELALADRLDLLHTLIMSESPDIQPTLIASLEAISLEEVSSLCTDGLTGTCA
ncbi:hypothetical protein KQ302_00970 [Synechococcus sp. CS-602]|uniref:hypothetical protein n=1 Tax=Synechococcaceae TaxID=1890426 RepID=UPI0008FF4582|nr:MULTISPECIES: hypothetical protein [Synechococcaceae]MCT4363659.1 hypothetical protein [Candidatus Regnicoccus frigidus MAG-AL1]APD47323.1 hypothetical protein BM449_02150 [Synechococcus sp. SynAce01]MCT0202779.1 hypothetical protein [Synechococcus sp. CS-603]MCT0203692.1 hypothetical protein [Synechococcus sp. CS-602]MCT0245311.1 hypothetical protein [Synechococcus sp. CS-601]